MKKNRYQSKKRITNYNYVNYISKLLEDITDIDPFENTRRLETVEIRSLLVYIMREVEGMTYESIRDYFENKGKSFDHSTALHAYRNYPMYCKYNKKLDGYFDMLISASTVGKAKKIKAKKIIDNCDPSVAEIFTYMIEKELMLE